MKNRENYQGQMATATEQIQQPANMIELIYQLIYSPIPLQIHKKPVKI